MDILTRILSLLEQQGKQQKDLADFLGINKNNITDWKSGKSRSYTKYLYQIAVFLETTPEYLKGETDEKRKTAGKPDGISNDEINALDNALDGLTEEELQQVRKYAEFLKQQRN